MPSTKSGTIDVTLLAGDYPATDAIQRVELHNIGQDCEFILPTTTSKRIELVIAGYVISLGYAPPVLLTDPETGDPVRPDVPRPEPIRPARITREWA